ncbi:MAG: methyltransferase family protein [Hyphomicrobiales bacterium]
MAPKNSMRPTNRFAAYFTIVFAALIGGGSLLFFGFFIIIGPVTIIRLDVSECQMFLWDGLLSILFFIQHSGMVRMSFRAWLSSLVPSRYHPSIYAIASGVTLIAVVLLWQTSPTSLVQLQGPLRWLPRAVTLLVIAGFVWGIRSLAFFDTFGLAPLMASSRGKDLQSPTLVVRGPYLWLRHPLYFFSIVLIWSVPDIRSDRLLFNLLWTLWIVLASLLEERDLVVAFGDAYRNYQKVVPMLLPWRGPAGRGL